MSALGVAIVAGICLLVGAAAGAYALGVVAGDSWQKGYTEKAAENEEYCEKYCLYRES